MAGGTCSGSLGQSALTRDMFNAAGLAALTFLDASRNAKIRLAKKDGIVDESLSTSATDARYDLLDKILATTEKVGTPAFTAINVQDRMKGLGQVYDPQTHWPLNTLCRYANWIHEARMKSNFELEQNLLGGLNEALIDGAKANIRSGRHTAISPALLNALSDELLEQHGMAGPWILNFDGKDTVTATIAVEYLTIRIPLRAVKATRIGELGVWVLESECEAYCNAAIRRAEGEIEAIEAKARTEKMPHRHKIGALKRILDARRDSTIPEADGSKPSK